jgi:hypothetical protein
MGETMKPVRVQLSRKAGWRMPPNTIKVTRPGKWGNPFKVGDRIRSDSDQPIAVCFSQAEAVEAFRQLLAQPAMEGFREDIRSGLRGKNLACWCRLGEACHADVLLELANAPVFNPKKL